MDQIQQLGHDMLDILDLKANNQIMYAIELYSSPLSQFKLVDSHRVRDINACLETHSRGIDTSIREFQYHSINLFRKAHCTKIFVWKSIYMMIRASKSSFRKNNLAS
jgi:hypothetical protein